MYGGASGPNRLEGTDPGSGMVGSMKTLHFGGNREIAISIDGPQSLLAGAGLHRLMFYVHLSWLRLVRTGLAADRVEGAAEVVG